MCGGSSIFSASPFKAAKGPGGLPVHIPTLAPIKPMSPKSLLSQAIKDNKALVSDTRSGMKQTLGA